MQTPNTLQLVSSCHQLVSFESEAQVELFDYSTAWTLVSGGSNLVPAPKLECSVLQPKLKGVQSSKPKGLADTLIHVSASAGENWHEFVRYCLTQGWFGLENLSLIPGWVGAAPVQNIGAYGREVSEFIVSVRAFDTQTGLWREFSNSECRFGYRDSYFKQHPSRFVITKVVFELFTTPSLALNYADLKTQAGSSPTPLSVSDAVIKIRQAKLPDPSVTPNAGSFFKNPVVTHELADALQLEHPNMPSYPASDGVKLAAGWLIDQAGLKGAELNGVGTHPNQALVLVNLKPLQNSQDQVKAFARHVQQKVLDTFGVHLEPEPVWLGSSGQVLTQPLAQ